MAAREICPLQCPLVFSRTDREDGKMNVLKSVMRGRVNSINVYCSIKLSSDSPNPIDFCPFVPLSRSLVQIKDKPASEYKSNHTETLNGR